ncbi:MAG: CPBP family intramembrane glutamic endopeptidase [Candidatus Nitrosotenuis sp.]
MQVHKILQGISIPYSALVSVVFGLLILSFPIGAYVFFNSHIGKSIDFSFPLSELEVAKRFGLDWLSFAGIGDLFVIVWSFFLILFVIGTLGPQRSFLKVLTPLMSGSSYSQEGNYIVSAIRWFSIIVVLSAAIDLIQRGFGVTISTPSFENDLVQFLLVSVAPIIEEIAFRVVLIGIPLYLFYSRMTSAKMFLKALWNPSSLPITDSKKAIAIIVITGVFFGAAHVLSEQWSQGKFAQAAMSGIIIGWAYCRYGFVVAILVHWAANYAVFSYAYLVSTINETRFVDAFSHSLIQTIEVLLFITGILSITMMILGYKKRLVTV